MEHFLNAASEAFAIINPQGRVLRANIAYRRLTGPAGGAHDASIASYVEPERRAACVDLIRSLTPAAPARSQEFRFVIGGRTKLIACDFLLLPDEGLIAFAGRDMSQRDTLNRERAEAASARDAVEQAGDIGHWRLDRNLKIQSSPGAARILGIDPGAPPLLLSDFVEMLAPEDRESAAAAAREAYDQGQSLKLNVRVRRPDGSMRMLSIAGSPSIGSPSAGGRGESDTVQGVVVDKTEGHAALQAAMNADSTVRRFVQAAPMPMAMYDREMRLLMASRGWYEGMQAAEEDVLGRCLYDINPWMPEKWRSVHRQVLRGEQMRHDRDPFERPDGGPGWMKWSCTPWRDASGEIGGVIIMHEDVTDLVRAQHEVESSKERMALGMSMTQKMIWEMDFDRHEIFLEGDWRQFFPQKPTFDSITGSDSWIHASDRELLGSKWRAHLAGGPPYSVEYRVTLGDGREVWHGASIRIMKTVKGAPARAFVVIQDITERKKVDAKVMDAEQRALVASAAKSDFLANMSHEIRTPLNGVLAVSEVLARTPLDERQLEMVRLIGTSGRTLLRVMDDLVEFSRLDGDQIEFEVRPFDLEEAIRQTCDAARSRAEAKGLKFETFISASVDGVFRGDRTRVGQVLGNLLNNAVKFTEDGGISVQASIQEDIGGGTVLHLSVADTGVGFSEEVAARIFERFEQADVSSTSRRFGGLGLGLSIVKRLVELMNGRVSARSKEGEGSTFDVVLPIERDRIAALGPLSAVAIEGFEAETTIENLRLLVAEDNPMNRRVVELLLSQSGLEITFAENGKEAVEKFSTARYDLVLMDLQMPIMGGLAATRAIRVWEQENGRTPTPIIAVSANATDEHVQEAKEAGADDHVAKPIVREVLFEAIARHGKPSADRASSAAMLDDDDIDLDTFDIAS